MECVLKNKISMAQLSLINVEVVSNPKLFCPPGNISGDIFGYPKGLECFWTSYKAEVSPKTKIHLAQNVNDAEVEKPCSLIFHNPVPPTKKNDWNNTAFWSIIISFGLIISQVICFPILTSNRCDSNSCLAKLHITSLFHDSASSRLLKNFNIMHAKICNNVLCVCSLLSLFFFLIHPGLTQTKSAHSWCLLHCEDWLPYQPVAQLELNDCLGVRINILMVKGSSSG